MLCELFVIAWVFSVCKIFVYLYIVRWLARQFYEDYKSMFDDDEDVQPVVLALQFMTNRDEIQTSKPVREFRYARTTRFDV